MIVTICTSTRVITLVASSSRKQRGRIRLDLDLDAPPPRETRRTFVTGVRVREVRGSRHPRSLSTAREKKRRARSPPSTGRTRARRMHAVIGEIVASREDAWSERRALRRRIEAIERRFESTNANTNAKARGRRHERARGGRIFVSRRHSSSRGRGDEQSRPRGDECLETEQRRGSGSRS